MNRKGQSAIEYALLITVVASVLVFMAFYTRRGFAAGIKQTVNQRSGSEMTQFNPFAYTSNVTTTFNEARSEASNIQGGTTTTITDGRISTDGTENLTSNLENTGL